MNCILYPLQGSFQNIKKDCSITRSLVKEHLISKLNAKLRDKEIQDRIRESQSNFRIIYQKDKNNEVMSIDSFESTSDEDSANPENKENLQFEENRNNLKFRKTLEKKKENSGFTFELFPISKIKTELCSFFTKYNWCRFGDSCLFAHGEIELRPKCNLPINFRTEICKDFQKNKSCKYGNRCWFIHPNNLEKPKYNYSLILQENCNEAITRINSFQNLKMIYKSKLHLERLPIFARITSLKDKCIFI